VHRVLSRGALAGYLSSLELVYLGGCIVRFARCRHDAVLPRSTQPSTRLGIDIDRRRSTDLAEVGVVVTTRTRAASSWRGPVSWTPRGSSDSPSVRTTTARAPKLPPSEARSDFGQHRDFKPYSVEGRRPRVPDPGMLRSVSTPRLVAVGDVLRYAKGGSTDQALADGLGNYWFLQEDSAGRYKRMLLEAGINVPVEVAATDAPRRPVIALRSSPWKAGAESNPWHDVFDLDHGHVRYYGDHKPSTHGPIGSSRGNRELLRAWRLHSSGNSDERAAAPPVLLFKAVPVYKGGRRIDKGHVEFCGVGVIERLEHVLQRDPKSGKSFPNLVVDLDMVEMDPSDAMDFRWIDDRRDPELTAREALRFAPTSWARWVRQGRVCLPLIRRRVLSSRVLGKSEQLPAIGSRDEGILQTIYHAFDDNKHAFEWLASRVAERVLGASGAEYDGGWLTKAGGDGGMDFVGRLDVGTSAANTPLVVLGQAKCVEPNSSVSPDQVARLVARLRRGWIGVFVTTGHFSRQAQVEVVDDEYPVVLIPGRVLAETVHLLAEESFLGDVAQLLCSALADYPSAITHRRPSEILVG